MEYINLMMTGNFDEFWFKNMMLVCLGHLNIQWDWPRCPSSWHSRHLYPFVMLNFQCLVASSLGQSMPHSCSLKDPMCFPFSISGYMPATKIRSLHSTVGSENNWQFCCQNLFHKGDHNFKICFKLKIIKKTMNTLRPRDSFCFLLVSSHFFYPNFKRPIPAQKVDLNSKYHSTSQSKERRSPAHVRTPSVISPEPLPKRPENPSGATAGFVGRVHLGPRRDQLLDHGGMAFQSRPMQRRLASGAEDATRKEQQLRLPSRNKAYSHGMFLRVVGQIFLDRS